MKAVNKTVYYCDFCKRRYMTKEACIKHEKRCTLNQDRCCKLCDYNNTVNDVRELCDKYQERFVLFEWTKRTRFCWDDDITIIPIYCEPFTLTDIIDDCDGCPNCILTVIRCLGLSFWYFRKKFKWDYKKALDDFWGVINEEAARQDAYDSMYY